MTGWLWKNHRLWWCKLEQISYNGLIYYAPLNDKLIIGSSSQFTLSCFISYIFIKSYNIVYTLDFILFNFMHILLNIVDVKNTSKIIRETINGHVCFSVSTIILYYNVCLLVITLSQQWTFPWYFINTELGRKHIYYLNFIINNSKFELKYNLWFHAFEYSQRIIVLLFLPETMQKRLCFVLVK